jgi:hypothetical protein
MSGKNHEALGMADEFLSRSQGSGDAVLLTVAHRMMGSTLMTVGEFQSARRHFEETIALSGRGTRPLYSLYMVEPRAASLLLLSWDLWFLGFPDQSLSRVAEALSVAQELRQPYTIAFAHYMTSVVHLLRGEPARALASAERSLKISHEQRFSLYVLLSNVSRGYALGELGQLGEGQTAIKSGIEEARSQGLGFMLPMMDSWLAGIHARSGDNETALNCIANEGNSVWPSIRHESAKPKHALRRLSMWREIKKRSPWSCARPPAWPSFGDRKVALIRRAI